MTRYTLIGILVFTLGSLTLTTGCGSQWRTHESNIETTGNSLADAPDWVRGKIPMDDDRIYFIGRSAAPDCRLDSCQDGYRNRPDDRVGYTILDERAAVDSARCDLQAQFCNKMATRNCGEFSNHVVVNIDSGNCENCTQPCTQKSKGSCSKGSGSSSCKCFKSGAADRFANTQVSQVAAKHRGSNTSYNSTTLREPDMDINVANFSMDNLIPAFMSHLREEEIYFEKWHVEDGRNGGHEWQSYKVWILASVSVDEYNAMVESMRATYAGLMESAAMWATEDRARRMAWEDESRKIMIARAEEDREDDREDEIYVLEHAGTIDKDRETMPGRRFRTVGNSR